MKRIILRALLATVGLLLALTLLVAAFVLHDLWRHEVFVAATYDHTPPTLSTSDTSPRLLVFSKTNSFRHVDAIPAANNMFEDFAEAEGWSVELTENAAVHTPDLLKGFDLIVWNNVSGDVLTEEQRAAFKAYVEEGGKVLGIHATGGDPVYQWDWYPSKLIRAQFIGHPLVPHFQDATINIEDETHPAMAHLPDAWAFHDEWYSFQTSPRDEVHVLASLDEDTYSPSLIGPFGDLAMGDHPIIWYHEVGEGTVFYSALGHLAEAYADEQHRTLLREACTWLLARKR